MVIRSPAVLQRLQTAETELATLREQEVVVDAAAAMAAIPVTVTRYRAMVEDLGDAPVDVGAAREQLREMLGKIVLRPEPNRGLVAELRLPEAPIRAVAGGCKIDLVAGGRLSLNFGRSASGWQRPDRPTARLRYWR
jgi:hypothetical protein